MTNSIGLHPVSGVDSVPFQHLPVGRQFVSMSLATPSRRSCAERTRANDMCARKTWTLKGCLLPSQPSLAARLCVFVLVTNNPPDCSFDTPQSYAFPVIIHCCSLFLP